MRLLGCGTETEQSRCSFSSTCSKLENGTNHLVPSCNSRKTMPQMSSGIKYDFSISMLIDDFLLLIFQALVDDMFCDDSIPRLDCFTLSHVCRRWRSLMLSTPRLWTRLHMVIRPRALSSPRLQVNVDRSADMPVDVVIYLPCPPNSRIWKTPGPAFPRTKACLEVLRTCSHRWRSLKIIKQDSSYDEVFILVLSKLCLSHAPTLHQVEIICPSSIGQVTSVGGPFQLLSSMHSPLLKKLTLEGCDSKLLPRHFDPSSLTHLSLNFEMEYDTGKNSHIAFRNLLSYAQNLVYLDVHRRVFRMEHADQNNNLDSITLPILRTLSIFMDAEDYVYLRSILRTITAPNLLHFALYNNSLVRAESSHLDFSSLLLQNQMPKFPSVLKLTMKNVLQSIDGPGKNIHCIFTAFPRVTDVVLDNDVREIADHLALESYNKKEPQPWPFLRHLTLEMPPMTKFYYLQPLIEWLRLRRARRLPLPVLVIHYELQGPRVNGSKDPTTIRRVMDDVPGFSVSDMREVARQVGKLGALVNLRVTAEERFNLPCVKPT